MAHLTRRPLLPFACDLRFVCAFSKTTGEAPSMSSPATKDEVQQVLTGKLRACDKASACCC